MNSTETNHSYDPVPFLPLFVAPRIITKEKDPQLYMVVGPAHDLVAECTINPKDWSTELQLDRVCSVLDETKYTDGGINPELGDGYPITNAIFDVDKTTLTIPNNNFCTGDVIQISKTRYTIQEKSTDTIVVGVVPKSVITIDTVAQLHFGGENDDLNDIDCTPPETTLKFMGIMGHTQPRQFHYFSGQVSIATIIRGPTSVFMTEKECESFVPGDPVYMHIIKHDDTIAKIIYSPFAALESSNYEGPRAMFSFLLGIFIVQKAYPHGALGYICLVPQSPPTFEIDSL